jgi:hypothetical protein
MTGGTYHDHVGFYRCSRCGAEKTDLI